jgi:outer membrane protein TolC
MNRSRTLYILAGFFVVSASFLPGLSGLCRAQGSPLDSSDVSVVHDCGLVLGFDERLKQNSVFLSIEEVSRLALENNFDIQLAMFDAEADSFNLDEARSVFDTYLNASADYTDNRKKRSSVFSGTKEEIQNYGAGLSKKLPTGTTLSAEVSDQRYWTNSGFVSVNPAYDSQVEFAVTQELGKNFFGLKDRASIETAKLDIENSEFTSLDKIEGVLAAVQVSYWKIARDAKIANIRKRLLKEAEELFGINREKIKKGLIEKPQLLASEANLKQRKIDLLLSQNQLLADINELKLFLNLEEGDKNVMPRDASNVFDEEFDLKESLKKAFELRRDYRISKTDLEIKEIEIVTKKNDLWPEINIQASYVRNGLDDDLGPSFKEIAEEDYPQYYAGISVSVPLENRSARAQLSKKEIEKQQALISVKKIERTILVEIHDAVRNCRILKQMAQKQKDVMEIQQEKLEEEMKKYRYGRSDTDTVIRYQDELFLSELNLAQAVMDYKTAIIDLRLKENSLLGAYRENTK